ncbi:MAG TPA: hypothetical protein VFX28_05210, partial [Methylomirabilota bacterium]|nr:hypothetical protein [Methylomirabilota bacterium]
MLTRERLLHPATILAVIALLVALSGAGYAATKIGTAQLKNNAVTKAKIKNGAVSTAKLQNGAVNSAKLAGGAVRAADLGSAAVGSGALANGAVTAAKIAAGAVGSSALATGSVEGAKLANGSVTDEKLGPNAVTGAKIAGGTITAANIAPGQVVKGNGELLSARLSLGPTPAGNAVLLTLPNIANVQVDCTTTGANTTVENTSGTTLTATVSGVNAGTGPFADSTPITTGGADILANGGTGGVQGATWQLSYGSGATAHVA